jgi:glycosyltransferase involved in cell wall biosynthesis
MSQKRLLLISNFYPPAAIGGAEIVAHRHAKLLADRDWSVIVLAGRIPSATVPEGSLDIEEIDGIPVYRLSIPLLDVQRNFRWERANGVFVNLIAAYRPDCVHFHNVVGLGVELIALAKQHGIRTVVTLHDNWGFCFKNTRLRNDNTVCRDFEECYLCRPMLETSTFDVPIRLRRDYVAFCLDQADELVSPSSDLAAAYIQAGFSNRVRVISNGIDLNAVAPIPRSPTPAIRFLCSAYLAEHKGILTLLEALKMLGQDESLRNQWHMSIAGHGHLEPKLRGEIEDAALTGNVAVLGRLDRAALLSILSGCHAVVLPSIWPENEPVSLLEGIASGAVLLASDLGGNRELVEHRVSGLLFRPGDPAALVDAMKCLITQPQLILTYSLVNINRRSRYDEELSVDALSNLLQNNDGVSSEAGDIVIICDGTKPDISTICTINLLSRAMPDLRLRLIWREWADELVWRRASAFWWWSATGGLEEMEVAARRHLPIIMRSGRESANMAEILPSVTVYENGAELVEAISNLRHLRTLTESAVDVSILRYYTQLRDRDSYYLSAGV